MIQRAAVAGLAVCLILLLWTAWARRQRGNPSLSQEQLQEGMRAVAAQAVEAARLEYGVSLDYSAASVERVEGILARLHEEHRRSRFSLAREKSEGWRWGAYVGEVILRISPGHWEMDHSVAGKGTFPVVVKRGDSFPIGWCRKRIVNGPEDNIWQKFQVLYLMPRASGTEGRQATGGAK